MVACLGRLWECPCQVYKVSGELSDLLLPEILSLLIVDSLKWALCSWRRDHYDRIAVFHNKQNCITSMNTIPLCQYPFVYKQPYFVSCLSPFKKTKPTNHKQHPPTPPHQPAKPQSINGAQRSSTVPANQLVWCSIRCRKGMNVTCCDSLRGTRKENGERWVHAVWSVHSPGK